ncbi:hypothetical protein ACFSKI_19045 [Pseudogracilibacillus auburnensis]|uniref:Uncharacterized protein n=1 Tax=Pseudogracilibacillus auburnensis TaxID=1494959 RepID=A0A2V3W373_9BACI|nr:hypothetical protein [Pseudogracilibacillus auburnensis]PXW88793.1 hypothetical protein DFR56_103299 [Pseudogracilibacillus auburnensis]
MNTRGYGPVYIEKGKDYVFCNEELEPVFERHALEAISEKWNRGCSIEQIAIEYERDPDEIFLAIFHQAREGKIVRKLNYRKPIKHLKIKKNVPTVIEYENRRYVYEPQNIRR